MKKTNNEGISCVEALAFLVGLLVITIILSIILNYQCSTTLNEITATFTTLK